MNNLAPTKNCPGGGGVQGNQNWMLGSFDVILFRGFLRFLFLRKCLS